MLRNLSRTNEPREEQDSENAGSTKRDEVIRRSNAKRARPRIKNNAAHFNSAIDRDSGDVGDPERSHIGRAVGNCGRRPVGFEGPTLADRTEIPRCAASVGGMKAETDKQDQSVKAGTKEARGVDIHANDSTERPDRK